MNFFITLTLCSVFKVLGSVLFSDRRRIRTVLNEFSSLRAIKLPVNIFLKIISVFIQRFSIFLCRIKIRFRVVSIGRISRFSGWPYFIDCFLLICYRFISNLP